MNEMIIVEMIEEVMAVVAFNLEHARLTTSVTTTRLRVPGSRIHEEASVSVLNEQRTRCREGGGGIRVRL